MRKMGRATESFQSPGFPKLTQKKGLWFLARLWLTPDLSGTRRKIRGWWGVLQCSPQQWPDSHHIFPGTPGPMRINEVHESGLPNCPPFNHESRQEGRLLPVGAAPVHFDGFSFVRAGPCPLS